MKLLHKNNHIMGKNFSNKQREALTEFIQETVDRNVIFDTLRLLESKIENALGSKSRYTTEHRLEKILESDLFKQPKPELDANHVDDPEVHF
tara:strand:+ start:674 stop:949 length:276 start_codon:yes stop_codon:yes gene_type:complete